jgi:hypothetical protein
MSKTTIPAGGIADSAVTTAKINADAVDATKIADDAISDEHLDATALTANAELAETPADTDEVLISDGGTLKRIDFSHLKSTPGLNLLGRSVNDDSGTSGGIQFNGIFTSTYRNYLLLIGKVAVETNTADLQVRLLDASNNSLTGSHYTRGGEYNDAGNNSVDEIQAIGTSSWIIGPSGNNGDATPTHGSFFIFNNTHTTTNDRVLMTGTGMWHHEAQHDPRMFYFGGSYANAVHAAGIRVETSTGNISDHEISIYGIKAY